MIFLQGPLHYIGVMMAWLISWNL